ncbi:MAG: hypothetical protein LBE51_14025 [Acidovorax sp.]|nr:hypothetical protein [Acidovorax sp.]
MSIYKFQKIFILQKAGTMRAQNFQARVNNCCPAANTAATISPEQDIKIPLHIHQGIFHQWEAIDKKC